MAYHESIDVVAKRSKSHERLCVPATDSTVEHGKFGILDDFTTVRYMYGRHSNCFENFLLPEKLSCLTVEGNTTLGLRHASSGILSHHTCLLGQTCKCTIKIYRSESENVLNTRQLDKKELFRATPGLNERKSSTEGVHRYPQKEFDRNVPYVPMVVIQAPDPIQMYDVPFQNPTPHTDLSSDHTNKGISPMAQSQLNASRGVRARSRMRRIQRPASANDDSNLPTKEESKPSTVRSQTYQASELMSASIQNDHSVGEPGSKAKDEQQLSRHRIQVSDLLAMRLSTGSIPNPSTEIRLFRKDDFKPLLYTPAVTRSVEQLSDRRYEQDRSKLPSKRSTISARRSIRRRHHLETDETAESLERQTSLSNVSDGMYSSDQRLGPKPSDYPARTWSFTNHVVEAHSRGEASTENTELRTDAIPAIVAEVSMIEKPPTTQEIWCTETDYTSNGNSNGNSSEDVLHGTDTTTASGFSESTSGKDDTSPRGVEMRNSAEQRPDVLPRPESIPELKSGETTAVVETLDAKDSFDHSAFELPNAGTELERPLSSVENEDGQGKVKDTADSDDDSPQNASSTTDFGDKFNAAFRGKI